MNKLEIIISIGVLIRLMLNVLVRLYSVLVYVGLVVNHVVYMWMHCIGAIFNLVERFNVQQIIYTNFIFLLFM